MTTIDCPNCGGHGATFCDRGGQAHATEEDICERCDGTGRVEREGEDDAALVA